ncbi:MAG: sigma factor-like helix-turn-helix DNA-binding protein, partial [Myxococcota bacterium]
SLRRRAGNRIASDDALLEAVAPGAEPSLALVKQEHRERFRSALEAALATLEPRARTLMRLHEVERISHARLATMYKVDRSTVTRWIAKARADVLAETRRQLEAQFGVAHHDFESFVDVIRSNFDASIHRMLDE